MMSPRRRLLAGAAGLVAIGGLTGRRAAGAGGNLPLEQARVDERLGVYKGAGCDGRSALLGFTDWLGREPGWVIDFLADQSWTEMTNTAAWITRCWHGANYRLSLAVPLLPSSDHRATLSSGAAGEYDSHFVDIARRLVAYGRPSAVIRLGWEFNGDWVPYSAAKDPTAFIAYWRRVVGTMRSVPGAAFRFDWNPTLGKAAIGADLAYPGDEFVDVIGLDVYNQSWKRPRPSSEARWQELLNQPYGLEWHRSFAAAKKKPRSFPEWGTGRRPDGSGGGDDPLFVTEMSNWLAASDVMYHGYWDYPAPDYNALMSNGQFPRAAAVFRQRFGAGSVAHDGP